MVKDFWFRLNNAQFPVAKQRARAHIWKWAKILKKNKEVKISEIGFQVTD